MNSHRKKVDFQPVLEVEEGREFESKEKRHQSRESHSKISQAQRGFQRHRVKYRADWQLGFAVGYVVGRCTR